MKRWIFYFFLLLFSIWLGLNIQADPGSIFIRYRHWQIETTLWFGLLGLFIFWFVLHELGRLLGSIIHLPEGISNYFDRRSKRRSQQEMLRGFSCLLEKRGGSAEKYFVKAARQNNLPFMNYLLAAQAAQVENRGQQCERYLKKATKYANDSDLKEALAFFEIEQAMTSGKDALALTLLAPLYKKRSRDPVLLKWLKTVYWKTHDWEALWELSPKLKKVLPQMEFQAMQGQVGEALLKEWIIRGKSLNALLDFWRKLPTQCRAIPGILLAYIEGLCHYNLEVEAEKVLMSAIKQHPDKTLIAYYVDFKSVKKERQIAVLESALSKHPQDPNLLFYLGRWYSKQQLWGKAEHYLMESLSIDAHQKHAWFELGHLYLQLGNQQKALDAWLRACRHEIF